MPVADGVGAHEEVPGRLFGPRLGVGEVRAPAGGERSQRQVERVDGRLQARLGSRKVAAVAKGPAASTARAASAVSSCETSAGVTGRGAQSHCAVEVDICCALAGAPPADLLLVKDARANGADFLFSLKMGVNSTVSAWKLSAVAGWSPRRCGPWSPCFRPINF